MFVVDPFKGEAYKKLVAENCRIYGSGALISSLALKGPFKTRFLPILYHKSRKVSYFEPKKCLSNTMQKRFHTVDLFQWQCAD